MLLNVHRGAKWAWMTFFLSGLNILLVASAFSADLGPAHAKVTPRLWSDTAEGRSARFLVVLADQTDTRPLKLEKMERQARGHALVAALREAATRSQPSIHKELKAHGARFKSYWVANLVLAEGKRELLENLAIRPDVLAIEADCTVQVSLPKVAPEATSALAPIAAIEPNIAKIRATNLWSLGYTGQNIVYANADTGVEWEHPALKRQYRGWNGTNADHNYNWWDAVHSDLSGNGSNPKGFSSQAPVDDNGHGTHTMGIGVGGETGNQIGVAPGAHWIACRNMDEGVGRPSTYLECMQFFLAPTDLAGQNPDPDRRPDCVGNSFSCPPEELCAPSSLHLALENLRAAGVFMAVSAGNEGPGCSTIFTPPALDSASFTVGATTLSDAMASFSSRGPVIVDGSNRRKPDLVAPGAGIRSSYVYDSYVQLNGTSMAAPHVAGAVALLWSAFPQMRGNVDYTQGLLQQTAVAIASAQTCGTNSPPEIPNNIFGYGRLDVQAAYQAAIADDDQDGAANFQEYLAGTNPHDSNSVLRISSITNELGGFRLNWFSIGGIRYRVQYWDGPTNVPANFMDISRPAELETNPAPPGTASTQMFLDDFTLTPLPLPNTTRLYRIRVVR